MGRNRTVGQGGQGAVKQGLLLGLAAFALAGCAAQTITVPKEVKVQVPVACVDAASRPQRPATRTESDLLAMERYRRTLAAWSDLKAYEAYSAELEAVVEGCSRIPGR